MWKASAWVIAAATGFGLVFTQTYKARWDDTVETVDIATLLGPDRPAPNEAPADGSTGAAVNILLIGEDSGADRESVLGDTTLILHISADRLRIDVVSIPRDTVVKIPDCDRSDGTSTRGSTTKFNAAFENGRARGSNADGAACTIKTVESLTDIPIDHFAVIGMEGFRDMVDAVGGVPMCIPVAYHDDASLTYLEPGPQVLDGTQAMHYVRMRKGINTTGSDLDRIDRQQEFLKNLASKVLSAEMLYRPQDVTHFIKAVAGSLTMDDGFGSADALTGLAFSLRRLNPSNDFTFATAPVMADPANPKVTVVFTSTASKVWQAIIDDQPIAPLLDAQSDSPANEAPDADSGATLDGVATPDAGGGSGAASEEEILNACTVGS